MSIIRGKANELLAQNEIDHIPLRFSDLSQICENLDCFLFSYTNGISLIRRLHLEQYTEKNLAFFWVHEKMNIIFYDSAAAYSDKLAAIAHEIGHFILGHTFGEYSENTPLHIKQEREADYFAKCLLAPLFVIRKCNLTTVWEIREFSSLPEETSESVYLLARDYTPDAWDDPLIPLFSEFIREHKKLLPEEEEFLQTIREKDRVISKYQRSVVCLSGILAAVAVSSRISKIKKFRRNKLLRRIKKILLG